MRLSTTAPSISHGHNKYQTCHLRQQNFTAGDLIGPSPMRRGGSCVCTCSESVLTFQVAIDGHIGNASSWQPAAVTLDGSRPTIVEDVCSTGAKLHGRNLPAEGEALIIRVGDVELLASVAWRKRDDCGITFEQPLDPAGVRQLKNEGQLGRVYGIV